MVHTDIQSTRNISFKKFKCFELFKTLQRNEKCHSKLIRLKICAPKFYLDLEQILGLNCQILDLFNKGGSYILKVVIKVF